MALTWTPTSSPFDGGGANCGVWAPSPVGLFVIGGTGFTDDIATSPDGAAWTGRGFIFGNPIATELVKGVAYSPSLGLFVAVGQFLSGSDDFAGIATSPDGIVWTLRSTPWDGIAGGGGLAVAWSDAQGLFVVGGSVSGADTIITSSDGITWSTVPNGLDSNVSGVCYSAALDLWAAVGNPASGPERLMTSPDASTWSLVSTPLDGYFPTSIFYSDLASLFVACSSSIFSNPSVATSPDGATFTAQTGAPTQHGSAGGGADSTANGVMVITGIDSGSAPVIGESADGAAWTSDAPVPFDIGGNAVCYSADLEVTLVLGSGSAEVIGTTAPPGPPPSGPQRFGRPLPWRFLVTNRVHRVLACLDPIASDRYATQTLNIPFQGGCKLPSGDVRVNRVIEDDDDPAVAAGTRFLIGLRRDGIDPPWTPQLCGVILQAQDDADPDRSITTVTAFGPDKIWEARPAVINGDGDLIGPGGYIFTAAPGSTIATALIADATGSYLDRNPGAGAAEAACYIDWGEDLGGTSFWEGTVELTGGVDVTFQQGSSLADALGALRATGSLDIVIRPIWDPVNRPGYLAEGSIVAQAGHDQPGAVFGWDRPPNNVTSLTRLEDTSPGVLVNVAQLFEGQGGPPVSVVTDPTSIGKYGEQWLLQFITDVGPTSAIESLAALIVLLAKQGKTVITVTPASERAPVPGVAYGLGDTVRLHASKGLRRPIVGETIRVSGIPYVISDDAVETVDHLITSADGLT